MIVDPISTVRALFTKGEQPRPAVTWPQLLAMMRLVVRQDPLAVEGLMLEILSYDCQLSLTGSSTSHALPPEEALALLAVQWLATHSADKLGQYLRLSTGPACSPILRQAFLAAAQDTAATSSKQPEK